jgi:hypothetical protein
MEKWQAMCLARCPKKIHLPGHPFRDGIWVENKKRERCHVPFGTKHPVDSIFYPY